MTERTELSFDGHGINGPDEYRTRIATFTGAHGAADYGPLFAAAPELLRELRALTHLCSVLVSRHQYGGLEITPPMWLMLCQLTDRAQTLTLKVGGA